MADQAFHERVYPSALIRVGAVAVGAAIGLLALPFGIAWAIPVAAVAIGLAIVTVIAATPSVEVHDGVFQAGPARIPVSSLGAARAIPASERTAALGRDLDAKAYVCFRSWVATAVIVEVTDPQDPTPYWLVSTRHPEDLIAALTDQAAHSEQTG